MHKATPIAPPTGCGIRPVPNRNHGNTFANYCNTFAYFHVTRDTFGAALSDLSTPHIVSLATPQLFAFGPHTPTQTTNANIGTHCLACQLKKMQHCRIYNYRICNLHLIKGKDDYLIKGQTTLNKVCWYPRTR